METILYQAMIECRNFFYQKNGCNVVNEVGMFEIRDNTIELNRKPLTNQYLMIKGSVLNDGVYKVENVTSSSPCTVLLTDTQDETFNGTVYFLAVPSDFLELIEEIKKFNEGTQETVSNGGIVSENYANYSYTLGTNKNGGVITWQDQYHDKLMRLYGRHYKERV